jgi:hypothetical protein
MNMKEKNRIFLIVLLIPLTSCLVTSLIFNSVGNEWNYYPLTTFNFFVFTISLKYAIEQAFVSGVELSILEKF